MARAGELGVTCSTLGLRHGLPPVRSPHPPTSLLWLALSPPTVPRLHPAPPPRTVHAKFLRVLACLARSGSAPRAEVQLGLVPEWPSLLQASPTGQESGALARLSRHFPVPQHSAVGCPLPSIAVSPGSTVFPEDALAFAICPTNILLASAFTLPQHCEARNINDIGPKIVFRRVSPGFPVADSLVRMRT